MKEGRQSKKGNRIGKSGDRVSKVTEYERGETE